MEALQWHIRLPLRIKVHAGQTRNVDEIPTVFRSANAMGHVVITASHPGGQVSDQVALVVVILRLVHAGASVNERLL